MTLPLDISKLVKIGGQGMVTNPPPAPPVGSSPEVPAEQDKD
jgi:hypothetical protein